MRRALLVFAVACGSKQPPVAPPPPVAAKPPVAAAPTTDEQRDDHAAAEHRLRIRDAETAEVTCRMAIHEPAHFAPPLGDAAPEREWSLGVRRNELLHECDHGWTPELLGCLHGAGTAAAVRDCTDDHLDPTERDELTAKLAEISELAAKIATAREKPAAIGCKQVVAAHYRDAKWKTKLAGFKPAERKKMIVQSRTLMAKACDADSWDELLRACVVAGGDQVCFESFRMGLAWGYPAAGSVGSLGIADCDAYGAAVATIARCDKLPQESRDSIQRGFDEMKAHMASQPPAERAKLASGCKTGIDVMKQVASSAGC